MEKIVLYEVDGGRNDTIKTFRDAAGQKGR